jgi:hypothetical protein
MRTPRPPLFLPRPGYRRRRLIDAARLLPVFGDTAPDGIYLFVVWAALVVVAAWLAPGLADAADEGDAVSGDDEPASAEKGDV